MPHAYLQEATCDQGVQTPITVNGDEITGAYCHLNHLRHVQMLTREAALFWSGCQRPGRIIQPIWIELYSYGWVTECSTQSVWCKGRLQMAQLTLKQILDSYIIAVFVQHLVKWGCCPPLGILHTGNTDNVLRPFQIQFFVDQCVMTINVY